MVRKPCCNKEGLRKGAWTAKEDMLLTEYINELGEAGWRSLTKKTGSRWSLIARRLPGRTDNEIIKNYWNTHLIKKLKTEGIELRRSIKYEGKQMTRRPEEIKANASSKTNYQKGNKETKKRKKGEIIESCNIHEDKDLVDNKIINEQWRTQNFELAVSAYNQDGTSCSVASTSTEVVSEKEIVACNVHSSSSTLEEKDNGIYEKLQVIDELLLNDCGLDRCTELNRESHNMQLKEVYEEEYFELVSRNSCHFQEHDQNDISDANEACKFIQHYILGIFF